MSNISCDRANFALKTKTFHFFHIINNLIIVYVFSLNPLIIQHQLQFLHFIQHLIMIPRIKKNRRLYLLISDQDKLPFYILLSILNVIIELCKVEKCLCEVVQKYQTCSSVGWELLTFRFNKHCLGKREEVLKNCSPDDFSIAHGCPILKIVWLRNCPRLKNPWLHHCTLFYVIR